MTLWNPLNVFSSGQASSSDEGPSAAFDPSQIGDPLGPPSTGPSIGFGDARVGTPAIGDPRRNPIGFAPPETETETRYRTEISFRRHNELPRASALPAAADDHTSTAWQSPEPVEDDVQGEAFVDETPAAEKSTPFFRREISFRRKKAAAELVVVAPELAEEHLAEAEVAADLDDEPAEVMAVADEPVEEPEIVAIADEPVEEIAAEDLETDANELVAEPVIAKAVPFYKREFGFGRNKDVAVVAVAAPTDDNEIAAEIVEPEVLATTDEIEPAEEPADEQAPIEHEVVALEETAMEDPALDDAVDAEAVDAPAVVVAGVPFYKRELSFRRKKTLADEAAVVVAADEVLSDEENATEVPAPADEHVETWAGTDEHVDETSHEDETSIEHETVALDETPVEAVEPAPVAEIAALHAVEPQAPDHSFSENEGAVEADAVDEAPEPVEVAEAVAAGAFSHALHADAPADDVQGELDVTDSFEHHVVEQEPVAVADAEPHLDTSLNDETPADDLPAAEVEGSDAVDAPAEETSDGGGRFGSRKQKAPKQKRSGGGAKGRKIVGLKIGASQIAAAVVSETEAGHELLQLARRSLAAGIVVDGEVRDEGALAGAVRALFDEEKLPKTDVHIGLSSNRIGVRTLDIDGVEDESRFDNAVRFKAHEVLPVALSESVLDYRVLEERVGEDGQASRRVLLVVAPRDQVEPYERVATQAGIKLSAIDLEALGLLRAFVEPGSGVPTPDDTATVVIAIGHESSTLLVSGGGACEFTRVFDWGGGALEEAIASSLEVPPVEAAMILRHLSLSGPGRAYDGLTDETRAKATDAVRQRLTPFARELVNSLQFYQTQAESLGIGGILVTGGTSHLEGLDEALHQMIGVDVSIGDPLARVVRATEIDPALEAMIGSLAVPIGLAIEDLATRGINLLPKGTSSKKGASRSTLLSIGVPVAAAIPLAALSFMYLGAHSKVVDNRNQLDAVKAQIAALPPAKAPVIDAGVVGDEATRATAVAQVLGGRLAWDAVFRDLARVLPQNVWLSTLQLTQPAADAGGNLADGTTAAAAPPLPGGTAASPTAVSIDGFTYTQPDVARLLARLATLPSLQRVTLTSSQSQLVGSKPVVHFVIVADLSSTGGAS